MNNISVKRDVALDVAKGIAIILVVLFHVMEFSSGDWSAFSRTWYGAFLYHSNMELFIFISGYLAYITKLDIKMIQHRSLQLIPPYLMWSIILFFCSSFIDTGFMLRSNLIKTILYGIWTLDLSSLWFLPLILGLCLILFLTRGKPWGVLVALLAVYGLSQIPWPNAIGNIHIPETAWFSMLAWFLPFFAGGYFISKYREKLHSLRYFKWFCLAAFPVVFVLGGQLNYNFFKFSWPDVSAPGWVIHTDFYEFGITVLFIGMAFAVAAFFARVSTIRRPFQYLGGITLGIYCSHALFRTIGIGSGILRGFLATLSVLLLSTALVWILQRTRVTNFLFLGGGQKVFSQKKIITPDKSAPATALKERKPS
jgi:fucose 4-O-acetylase-like acetyltransferase